MIITPPYLKKTIRLELFALPAICLLKKLNNALILYIIGALTSKIGKTLGNQFNYFSGTDEEHLNDLQSMIDDKKLKPFFVQEADMD